MLEYIRAQTLRFNFRQVCLFIYLFIFTVNIFFLSFVFLGPHSQHMEVPRLGVQLELQLPAYATATATPDP